MTEEYLAYLNSEAWQIKRYAALVRAGHKCQVCSSVKILQAHHNTYARLFNELDTDLVVLCEACHRLFHQNKTQRIQAQQRREDKARKRELKKQRKAERKQQRINGGMLTHRDWIERQHRVRANMMAARRAS